MPSVDSRAPHVSVLLLAVAFACAEPGADSPPAAGAGSRPAADAAPPEVQPAPIHTRLTAGVDVSGHSGEVNWIRVAEAGHTFAFVKATEGVDLKDAAFDANWAAMKAAGVIRGAYHFYVTEDDPVAQARWYTSNVTLGPGDLAPVVDLELIGRGTIMKGLDDRIRTFLATVEQHYGVKPIIYTSPNFWDKHMGPGFGDHPLWLAEYAVDTPRLPQGWDTWHLWQWKGDAQIDGVAKTADLSRANAAGADLSALVIR